MAADGARCPACLARRSRLAYRVNDHPVRRCRACRSLFVADPPPADELASLYRDAEYFANPHYGPDDYRGYRDYLADRAEIESKFRGIVERIEGIAEPGRLLDVGSGPGLLLSVARSRGWEASGLDINPWAAEFARERVGVPVTVETLEQAGLASSCLDAVTMLDLLEHVPSPDPLLAEAARATRPGGALAVLTPIASAPAALLLGRRWPELRRVPEHTTLYSLRGLRAALHRHRFTPVAQEWIGKRSTVQTLLADLAPIAPGAARALSEILPAAARSRTVALNPRVKACVYARRDPGPAGDGAVPRGGEP
jgi:SAM-dependent methyltransferase